MLKKIIYAGIGSCFAFLVFTSPWTWALFYDSHVLESPEGVELHANLENGERIFLVGDCGTCHATDGGEDHTLLGGGWELDTKYGVFYMSNISPHKEQGIGNWTLSQFDRAVRQGISPSALWPDGENLYPSHPYTSYRNLKDDDVRDLYAYIMSLPPQDNVSKAHDLKFPYCIRRGVGLWRLFFQGGTVLVDGATPAGIDPQSYHRGRYLVETVGHCVECHSPRTVLGNIKDDLRFSGGPFIEGEGWFPNITPHETGIGFWSEASIAQYLRTGTTPLGRNSAGSMDFIIHNTSKLSDSDLKDMALFLKNLPPIDSRAPGVPAPNYSEELVLLEHSVATGADLPTSSGDALKEGVQALVVRTKEMHFAPDDHEKTAGEFLSGAAVRVEQRQGGTVALKLEGWQLEGSERVLFQEKGKRIMTAVLDKDTLPKLERGAPQKDEVSGKNWFPVSLTLWTDAAGMHTNPAEVWDFSSNAYAKSCAGCHVLYEKDHYTANQWIGVLKSMRRYTSFDDEQYRLVLNYLQNNARDM